MHGRPFLIAREVKFSGKPEQVHLVFQHEPPQSTSHRFAKLNIKPWNLSSSHQRTVG